MTAARDSTSDTGIPSSGVFSTVELARQQWSEGHRRLEAERADARRYRDLLTHVEAVTDELRRRVGGVYTVAELAVAYHALDSWLRAVLAEADPRAAASPDATVAADAAFHLYARGARDYEP